MSCMSLYLKFERNHVQKNDTNAFVDNTSVRIFDILRQSLATTKLHSLKTIFGMTEKRIVLAYMYVHRFENLSCCNASSSYENIWCYIKDVM